MSAVDVDTPPEFAAECAAIWAAREAAYAGLREANRAGLAPAAATAALEAHAECDARTEELRARHFPRHRLIIAHGEAWVMTPKGRTGLLAWDGAR